MARRKPAAAGITRIRTTSGVDVIVKGFRVMAGKPVSFRLINPTPDRATIRALQATPATSGLVTLAAPKTGGEPVAFDFEVLLTGPAKTALQMPVEPMVVEIESGARRYREAIMPALRPQRLRYHLYLTEPSTGMILCPRHGVVRANSMGLCPRPAPHTV